MHEAAKKGFEALVDALSLAIRLRMVSRAHRKSGLSKAEQLKPKGTGKNAVAVRNDTCGKAMQAVDVIKEKLCDLLGRKGMEQRDKMCELTEFVDNHHQTVR